MKVWGYLLLILGAFVSGGAWVMKTSVYSPAEYRFGSFQASSETLNLGLLQNQQLVFMGGLALFVAGAVLAGAGAIVEALVNARLGGTIGAADRAEFSQLAATAQPAPIDPEALAAQQAATDRGFYLILAIGLGVTLLIGILIWATSSPTMRSAESAPIEANVDAAGDNLQAMADNMEEMVDGAERRVR